MEWTVYSPTPEEYLRFSRLREQVAGWAARLDWIDKPPHTRGPWLPLPEPWERLPQLRARFSPWNFCWPVSEGKPALMIELEIERDEHAGVPATGERYPNLYTLLQQTAGNLLLWKRAGKTLALIQAFYRMVRERNAGQFPEHGIPYWIPNPTNVGDASLDDLLPPELVLRNWPPVTFFVDLEAVPARLRLPLAGRMLEITDKLAEAGHRFIVAHHYWPRDSERIDDLTTQLRKLVGDAIYTPAAIGSELGKAIWRQLRLPEPTIEQLMGDLEAAQRRNSARLLTNLPDHLPAGLVARHSEASKIAPKLHSPDGRVVLLYGEAGVGKSTAALAAAARNLTGQFEDGVYIVDFRDRKHGSEPWSEIARLFGITLGSFNPRQELTEKLTGKRALLVLDNFDGLVSVAPELAKLAHALPDLKLLVTCRTLPEIDAEAVHIEAWQPPEQKEIDEAAQPGPVAGWSALLANDVVTLFLHHYRPDPRLDINQEQVITIARICRLWGGVPEQVKLRARLARQSPAAILELLQSGQDSATGSLEQILAALPAQAEEILSLLTVFAASPDLVVLRKMMSVKRGFDNTLRELMQQGLVESYAAPDGNERLRAEEMVLKQVRQQFRPPGGAWARLEQRHARYFLEEAARLCGQLRGPLQIEALAWFARERDEINVALEHTAQAAEKSADLAADLLRWCAALGGYWYYTDDLATGKRWLEHARHVTEKHLVSTQSAGRAARAEWLAARAADRAALANWLAAIYTLLDQQYGSQNNILLGRQIAEQAAEHDRRLLLRCFDYREACRLTRLTWPYGDEGIARTEYEVEQKAISEHRRALKHASNLLEQLNLTLLAHEPSSAAETLLLADAKLEWAATQVELAYSSMTTGRSRRGRALTELKEWAAQLCRDAEDSYRRVYNPEGARQENLGWDHAHVYSLRGECELVDLDHAGEGDEKERVRDRAREQFRQGLRIYQRVNNRRGQATCLTGLAVVASQAENAALLFGAAHGLRATFEQGLLTEKKQFYKDRLSKARRSCKEPERWDQFYADGQSDPAAVVSAVLNGLLS